MEYLDYLLVGAICYWIGYAVRGFVVLTNLARDPQKTIEMLEQIKKINEAESQEQLDATMDRIRNVVPDATELFIEQVNGVFYAYIKDTNRFVAQGSSLAELLDTAHKRFPDSKFFGTVEEEDSAKQVAQ